MRRLVVAILYALAMVGLLLGGLKLVDRAVARHGQPTTLFDTQRKSPTIRTLELYPYEGFHMQANHHHRGPMPWDDHSPEADFDVRTGDRGFFIDFSLDTPPPKAPGEFRVVLIGGSGAQGWGGTSNEKMFYAVLERTLGARLAGSGTRVRVINLAMGGTVTYQNFITLNRYGHALEPDLILAYIGRNDFFVPIFHEQCTDLPMGFNDLRAFTLATRGSEFPPGMAWLAALMPNTMRRTSVGLGLKVAFGWPYFQERAREGYAKLTGRPTTTVLRHLDRLATPQIVHSLTSIKRDFGGVPIMVAWQPIDKEFEILGQDLDPGFYQRLYERVRLALQGQGEGPWYFVNVHEMGRERQDVVFGTHLTDESHAVTGAYLADQIGPLVPGLLAERRRRAAAGLPPYGR